MATATDQDIHAALFTVTSQSHDNLVYVMKLVLADRDKSASYKRVAQAVFARSAALRAKASARAKLETFVIRGRRVS